MALPSDDHDGSAFVGDGEGLSHGGLDGDAVHDDVGAFAQCSANLLGGVAGGGVDGGVGAEFAGFVPLGGHDVGDDDAAGPVRLEHREHE